MGHLMEGLGCGVLKAVKKRGGEDAKEKVFGPCLG